MPKPVKTEESASLPAPSELSPTDTPAKALARPGRWQRLSQTQKQVIAGSIGAFFVLALVAATSLRYPVLGLVHKGTLDVTVTDDITHQPLLGAQIEVGSKNILTDKYGRAILAGLPLGKTDITITKQAYKTKSMAETLFWNPVKLSTVNLHSTGVPIKFMVKDWVSGKAVDGVEIMLGKASGVTDFSGAGRVSLEPAAVNGAKATLKKSGYNSVTAAIGVVGKVNELTLVPEGDVYFFSNRSGRIDLYSSKLDGSNPTVVLAGTGNEDEETGLLLNVNDPDCFAILSSRAGVRQGGSLEHDLYMFDGEKRKLTKVDTDLNFTDFRAWVGSSLVYFKTDNNHSVIRAFDMKTQVNKELTSISGLTSYGGHAYLTGLGVAGQEVYYNSVSSNLDQNGFYVVGLNASPRRLDARNVDLAYRQSKDSLTVQLSDGTGVSWKKLNTGTKTFSDLPGEPATRSNRGYADSQDGQHSIFVETRDGKSELYATDARGGNEQSITSFGKVNQFVQWFNNRYIAFSSNQGESSIYVVPVDGGPAKKITDFFQGNGRTYGGGYNPVYF